MKPAAADAGAVAALSLGAVLIGLAPIFVRVADVGPIACAFWRCALAVPPLWLALRRFDTNPPAQPAPGALVLAGLFFAADLALWHCAIGRTSVANATLLANLAPLFVAPGAWLLWRERITPRFFGGLLLALVGTVILVGRGATLGRSSLSGDSLAIVAAAFYAGYLLTATRLRRDHGALRLMTWSSATVAAALLPVALLSGETLWPASLRGWAVLAGLALLSHIGGQGLIAQSLARLPASFSAVGLLIQPVAATLFAWALLGERFGPQQALGAAVVLAGIAWCRLSAARAPQARAA